MRIGELSRAAGVSADVLRAWERRYGLLSPERTSGGFRLYSHADLARVQSMLSLVEAGVPASEAARRLATGIDAEPTAISGAPLDEVRRQLRTVLRAFDDGGAQAVLDRLLAAYELETVIVEVLLPELRSIGDDWAAGAATVGQEHFAANLLRGRLLALGRGWDRGVGPRLVLACPEGELHDISLVMFGLVANRRGWRITFLGADTPLESLASAVRATDADAVVIYSTTDEALRPIVTSVELLAPAAVYVAGPGAEAASSGMIMPLGDDVLAAAERISGDWRQKRRAHA